MLSINDILSTINTCEDIKGKDKRYFMIAAALSDKSTFRRARLGAVAVYKHHIIGSGINSEKTHPTQKKYNMYRAKREENLPPKIHAEIACIQSIDYNFEYENAEMYIFRSCKNKPYGNARPCKACMKALKEHGFKRIHYSTDDGFATEIIH